ncbi:hypothetical protein [Actinomadura gamaensis]|uniref:Uncharacterized protein n=1 Tax=Actinomadura gamaensis TaxID=1763541 RepID=A0ABV9TQ71_9ACTN
MSDSSSVHPRRGLLRRLSLGAASLALCAGGLAGIAPTASATGTPRPPSAGDVSASAVWTARVKCQIVRHGAAIGYREGGGFGKNRTAAVNAAKRNVKVPHGAYKRHCRVLWVIKGTI